jgi:hypothetical protein
MLRNRDGKYYITGRNGNSLDNIKVIAMADKEKSKKKTNDYVDIIITSENRYLIGYDDIDGIEVDYFNIPYKFDYNGVKYRVIEIGDSAFENDKKIADLIIEEGIRKIGKCAFSGCKYLTNVKIPSSVKRIEPYAFSDCLSIEKIELPEGLEYLGDEVFFGCEGIEYLVLPESLKYIGKYAFEGINYDGWFCLAYRGNLATWYSKIERHPKWKDYGYRSDIIFYPNYNGESYTYMANHDDYEYIKEYDLGGVETNY